MLSQHGIRGCWKQSAGGSVPELVSDYMAGLLVTTVRGEDTRGPPDEFRSTDGESGTEILQRVLRPPRPDSLRYGAIRECLAAARSVSIHGFQETRAWDTLGDYIVDTGEGSCAIVRFVQDNCVAVMTNYDPWRQFELDHAILLMPLNLQQIAREVAALPLLNSPGQLRISSLFWSDGSEIEAGEPWPTAYAFGAEILRRELQDDERWQEEAGIHYDIEPPGLAVIMELAKRRLASPGVVVLTVEELVAIAPEGSLHRADALELLSDMAFSPPQSRSAGT